MPLLAFAIGFIVTLAAVLAIAELKPRRILRELRERLLDWLEPKPDPPVDHSATHKFQSWTVLENPVRVEMFFSPTVYEYRQRRRCLDCGLTQEVGIIWSQSAMVVCQGGPEATS
jgi:hypothetical protein